jgi:hypothetical protein
MAAARQGFAASRCLKRDSITIIRHRALALYLGMILTENRFTLFRNHAGANAVLAGVLSLCLGMIFSENRFTLFRIMPVAQPHKGRIPRRKGDVSASRQWARCLPGLFA